MSLEQTVVGAPPPKLWSSIRESLRGSHQDVTTGNQNRAIEIARREVLMRAAQGFAYGAPQLGRGRPDYCLFQRHIDLYVYVLRGASQKIRRTDAAAAIKQ